MDASPGFVTTVPGLGPAVVDELARTDVAGGGPAGATVENDGRADVVAVPRPTSPAGLLGLRTAEDAFAEIAVVRGVSSRARAVASAVVRRAALSRALDRRGAIRPLRDRSFRVVVRVLSERSFPRTALRAAVVAEVARALPGWHESDPGDVEVWVLETLPGMFRSGVRLSTGAMRQGGDGRAVERSGALRPAVAAAMVALARTPPVGPGALLDPCCGSGTIVAEALATGWERAVGGDVDAGALAVAARNVHRGPAGLVRLDARGLPFPDAAFAAVVTNLPFGRQFTTTGAPVAWYRRVLQESRRVAPRSVVLVPPSEPFRRALGRLPFSVARRLDLVLLGAKTTLWVLDPPA